MDKSLEKGAVLQRFFLTPILWAVFENGKCEKVYVNAGFVCGVYEKNNLTSR
jgi:hypothetical protein